LAFVRGPALADVERQYGNGPLGTVKGRLMLDQNGGVICTTCPELIQPKIHGRPMNAKMTMDSRQSGKIAGCLEQLAEGAQLAMGEKAGLDRENAAFNRRLFIIDTKLPELQLWLSKNNIVTGRSSILSRFPRPTVPSALSFSSLVSFEQAYRMLALLCCFAVAELHLNRMLKI
jgi:hypothetical protein